MPRPHFYLLLALLAAYGLSASTGWLETHLNN